MLPERRRAGRAIRKRARRRRVYELVFKAMGIDVSPWQLDWLLAEPLEPVRIRWRRRG